MLSGETAIGAFPCSRRGAALRIALAAEEASTAAHADGGARVATAWPGRRLAGDRRRRPRLARPAVTVLVTAAGGARGATAAAAQRPHVPIVAVVSDARSARLLMVVRGVSPVIPSDPALAQDPGVRHRRRPCSTTPRVRAALPRRPAVVLAGSDDGDVERIEALPIAPVGP